MKDCNPNNYNLVFKESKRFTTAKTREECWNRFPTIKYKTIGELSQIVRNEPHLHDKWVTTLERAGINFRYLSKHHVSPYISFWHDPTPTRCYSGHNPPTHSLYTGSGLFQGHACIKSLKTLSDFLVNYGEQLLHSYETPR